MRLDALEPALPAVESRAANANLRGKVIGERAPERGEITGKKDEIMRYAGESNVKFCS